MDMCRCVFLGVMFLGLLIQQRLAPLFFFHTPRSAQRQGIFEIPIYRLVDSKHRHVVCPKSNVEDCFRFFSCFCSANKGESIGGDYS